MQKSLILFFLTLMHNCLYAQHEFNVIDTNRGKDTIYYTSDKKPSYLVGSKIFLDSLSRILYYPEISRIKKESAFLELDFVVNKKGVASDVNIFSSSTVLELSDEGLKKVEAFITRHYDEWIPAEINNKAVNAYYGLEITFSPEIDSPDERIGYNHIKISTDTITISDILYNKSKRKVCHIQNSKHNTAYPNNCYQKTEVDTEPEFIGGKDALMKWIYQNINYPANARESGITGKIIIELVIDEKGTACFAKLLSDSHPLLNTATFRLLSIMPEWKPATYKGKKVKTILLMPFSFKLDGAPLYRGPADGIYAEDE